MDNHDDTIVSLTDHKAKLQKREEAGNKETDVIANPAVPSEILKDLDACLEPDDMEATLRVFEVLRTMGDGVTVKIDHSDIYITIHHDESDSIDAGVDFPEQVIKSVSTEQMSTINFDYKEEEWDSMENFFYNVGFALRRCIESLTYWSTGEKKDD